MSAHAYTEDQLVEQPAVLLFAELAGEDMMQITLAPVAPVENPR